MMMILEAIFVSSLLIALSSTQSDVRKPPTITRGPSKSMIYRSDDSITLDCKADGVPVVACEWKKNGKDLDLHLQNIYRGADGSITINPTSSLDEGFYQCFASNQYGTALSITAHLQRAFLSSTARNTTGVLNKTVLEGTPFHILADARNSFPKGVCSWELTNDTVDKDPDPLRTSKRIQIAENGDLHFAYALPVDDLAGRFYRCSTYNPYLDVKAGGSYTQLTVLRNSSAVRPFAPVLAFSSALETVALIGGSVLLRCFFSGNPEPSLSWSGPRNSLPIGRYRVSSFNTELVIYNITATDEGEYKCNAANTQGVKTHFFQIRVEAATTFFKATDGPYDMNVTEGESITFNCNASAKPDAKIVWLQDGQELDTNSPPRRFRFSSDLKSLTIRDVCRDCVDRESKTDLTVIQCNASNVHGYAFAQGYLNVLSKTRVRIEGETDVVVAADEEREIQFVCKAESDPSTPPVVRWYKAANNGAAEMVYDDPPYVVIREGILNISVSSNSSRRWTANEGRYRCQADNGYSRDTAEVSIRTITKPDVPGKPKIKWWIYVSVGVACFIVLLLAVVIGVLCVGAGKRRNRLANGEPQELGAKRCDYIRRTSDLGPFRRHYPTDETSLVAKSES